MTLLIAIASEAGAVLCIDSMTMRITAGGNAEGYFGYEDKLIVRGSLDDGGVAYAVSGHRPEHVGLAFPLRGGDFVATARALYADLLAAVGSRESIAVPVGADAKPEELRRLQAQDMIVVALPPTSRPSVGLLTLDSERWLPPEGGLLISGAATLWGEDVQAGTLRAATEIAAMEDQACALGRAFIKHAWEGRTLDDYISGGLIPPVAPPLNVLTISPREVAMRSVNL